MAFSLPIDRILNLFLLCKSEAQMGAARSRFGGHSCAAHKKSKCAVA